MRITSHPELQLIHEVTAMRKIHVGWRKNWKIMCSNKSCLPLMLDKQGAVHGLEAQQEEIGEEDEAQEELSSWGILLTRSVAKDNETKWTVIESGMGASGRFGSHNVLREQPVPTPHATRSVPEDKVSSARRSFIDDSILRHIKHCTEAEVVRAGERNWSLAIEELDAFIALVYARGAYGCRSVDCDVLWNVNWGLSFFPDTMSRNRFREIMRYLKFDLNRTRSQRLQCDKFALASGVWQRFIDNCFLCYRPGANVTADEQLFPSKARCRFTQYMANKPDKFGIKFWVLVDNDTKYLYNAFPYLGKDELRSANESLPESVVMRLMSPYLNKGRDVTTYNFITSATLSRTLKANDRKFLEK